MIVKSAGKLAPAKIVSVNFTVLSPLPALVKEACSLELGLLNVYLAFVCVSYGKVLSKDHTYRPNAGIDMLLFCGGFPRASRASSLPVNCFKNPVGIDCLVVAAPVPVTVSAVVVVVIGALLLTEGALLGTALDM